MRMARCRQLMALCAAAVVLLSACNGDDSSAPTTTAPSSTAPTATVPPSTTASASQVELDRQKGQRVVLTAADLPGFTMGAPDEDDDSAELEAAANACVNNDRLLTRLGEDDDPRGANSTDFHRSNVLTVNSGVTFGETEDEARTSMTALGAPSFTGCFSNDLAAELRQRPTFTGVSVSTARLPALSAGDQSAGYRSTARAQVSGQSVTFYFDFTFIRSGRVLAVISALGIGTPFPEAERSRLATTVAGRMAAP